MAQTKKEGYLKWLNTGNNRELKNAQKREWNAANRARTKAYKIEHNTPEIKARDYEKHKEWKDRNPERLEAYRAKNRAKVLSEDDRKRRSLANKKYSKKPEIKTRTARQIVEREKIDLEFKLIRRLRARTYKCFKFPRSRSLSLINNIGCTKEFLLGYIENLFKPGMTWDNYGKWHVDHIKPLSLFNMLDESQFKQAVHYSNLQPLWALENIKKSNKYKEAA